MIQVENFGKAVRITGSAGQTALEFEEHLQAISAGSTGSGQAEVHTQK